MKIKRIPKIRYKADVLDPRKLKAEITCMEKRVVRAVINYDGKMLSVNHWDFTKAMIKDMKSPEAKYHYSVLMERARAWLETEMNKYKYPSH